MTIVLFGSTELTAAVADFLHSHNYKISAIITVPQHFNISYSSKEITNNRFTDMHAWGSERKIPVITYENAAQAISKLQTLETDISFAIVVGWYHFIPTKLRALFPLGCAGFHASLLPKLRGGAPLNWALLNGLSETGVSFFKLGDGIDDGLLYAQEKFLIESDDYINDLIKKSQKSILRILDKYLPNLKEGHLLKYQQVGNPSYCGQRNPQDSLIDWEKPADSIIRLIKASSKPYAGAYSFLNAEKIIIWKAEVSPLEMYGIPGQIMVIASNIYIICGTAAILLKEADNYSYLAKSNHQRLSIL